MLEKAAVEAGKHGSAAGRWTYAAVSCNFYALTFRSATWHPWQGRMEANRIAQLQARSPEQYRTVLPLQQRPHCSEIESYRCSTGV